MSKTPETIDIQFPRGGRIPASVLGKGDGPDVVVAPKKTVTVPFAYGRSLVDDRFAIEAPAETSPKPAALQKSPTKRPTKKELAAEKAKKVDDAQLALKAAEEALAAETDDARKVDLAAAVEAARSALEEAQDA